MKRKSSPIPSLLAARVRTTRRPPAAFRPAKREFPLLDSLQPPPPDRAAASPDYTALDAVAQQAAAALRIADAALNDIHARLQQVGAMLSPLERGQRRSPQQIIALQVELDSAVEAIEHLARETAADGRFLLRGDWSCNLPAAPGEAVRTLRIASMLPVRLGNTRLGFLSMLREGAAKDLRTTEATVVAAIVQAALRQIAEQRRQIEVFSETVVQPCTTALAVLAENHNSAASALGDADFAAWSSRFTAGQALVFIPPPPADLPITGACPGLRFVRD